MPAARLSSWNQFIDPRAGAPGEFTPASIASQLHLIDTRRPSRDPLLPIISKGGRLLKRSADRRLEAIRLRRDVARLLRRQPGTVVCWSRQMLEAVRGVNAPLVWRPGATEKHITPDPQMLVVAQSEFQRQAILDAAQPSDRVVTFAGPVVPGHVAITRRQLGLADHDFAWLLTSETASTAGLRRAVWVGALLHVMFRDTAGPNGSTKQRHRLVIVGDSERHRIACRFIDQLGLPGLGVSLASNSTGAYVNAAMASDGMILLHDGPASAWPLRVGVATGLRVLCSGTPELSEMRRSLGESARNLVRVSRDLETRTTVSAALDLLKAPAGRAADGLVSTRAEVCRAWSDVLAGVDQAASGIDQAASGVR